MKCPFCNFADTQVKDSRATHNDTIIRRRRYCDSCKAKFSTAERIHLKELYVLKRSGMRKPFDRSKIKNSIETATRKRNIPINEIEKIVDEIIRQIESSNIKELSTKKIGELLMQSLLKVDLVAYVRFASVYKDFSSPEDFIKFISSIK
jgi:transcriptional repressor NrdR